MPLESLVCLLQDLRALQASEQCAAGELDAAGSDLDLLGAFGAIDILWGGRTFFSPPGWSLATRFPQQTA